MIKRTRGENNETKPLIALVVVTVCALILTNRYVTPAFSAEAVMLDEDQVENIVRRSSMKAVSRFLSPRNSLMAYRKENWLPINRTDENLDIVMRVYAPDMERL